MELPPFSPVSPQALAISHLFVVTILIALAVFALVTVWLVVNLVRFRQRPGEGEPEQQYGNKKLEITWTIAPAVILAVLFVFSVRAMAAADPSPPGNQQPDIIVVGHQWWWEVRYPATGAVTANEIHLPVGKRLYVRLESADVIHSLWLPRLSRKMDLVPGQVNHVTLEADTPGVYLGNCAEYCGTQHAWMLIRAIAEPPEQFDAWQRAQLQPAPAATGGDAEAGAKLFQHSTCVNCHAVGGTVAQARVGPDLTHVAGRQTLAGGVLDNSPDAMATWLRDPQKVKPGNHMPNFRLGEGDVRSLTAYMETLR